MISRDRARGALHLRRYLWLVGLAVIVLVGAAALTSMQLGRPAARASVDACTPKPCAAPSGFGAYFSNVALTNGLVRLQVAFINHPHPQAFAGYNHTSPADFQLRSADGSQVKPMFNQACPDWGELRVKIGDSAGPEPLCFRAGRDGVHGALVIWGPDLGFLFDDVQVPLD